MYKLIYADEERGGAEGLLDRMDWNREGFQLVGRCGNGDELMNLGIYDPVEHGDFMAYQYHFKAIN